MPVASIREYTTSTGETTHRVRFRVGRRETSRTFEDARSAEKFADLVEVLGPKRALLELESIPTGPTLDQLVQSYWPYRESRVRSDRTVADYKRDYDNWISPHLGHLRAATIDERDVQGWVDKIQAMTKNNGEPRLSAKSIADKHAILHGIFKWASSPTRELVPSGHNPTIGTELPPRVRKPPQGLRPAEWQALHAALATIDVDAGDLALFLVATGCRWSEAVALDTHSVEDFGDDMWVTIRQVARRNAAAQTKVVADTKSDAGARRLKLDRGAAAMVRRRLQTVQPGGLVFTTSTGARWDHGHFRARKWNKAVKAAGLRHVTIHMLRHTAVGYLALSGKVSMAEIQRRIGHKSITTTFDVYGGMIEDVTDDALDFLQAMRETAPKPAGEVTETADELPGSAAAS